MQVPLQITFHDVDHSAALEERIREKVAKLEQYCDQMTSCRVTVEAPHKHHHQGYHFNIRLDVTLPGHEIVVKRDPADKGSHEDPYVALRDAFDAARRQIKEYKERQMNKVKHHAAQ